MNTQDDMKDIDPRAIALFQALKGKKSGGIGQKAGNFLTTMGGGTPPTQEDHSGKLLETILGEQAKSLYRNPLDDKLKQAEIDALSQPPPTGFVRVGKQTLADPNHVNPNEQVAIDREERQHEKEMADQQAAKEAKESSDNLIRMRSQDVYDTATNIEKGANFFGPIGGDLPTWAAPSSWLPGGKTPGERTDWEANLDKLRASLTLEQVNAMRSTGTTGSTGMGVLSNSDIKLLTDAATALRRNLEPKDAMRYIKQIKDVQAKFLGINNGGQQLPGGGGNDIDAELAEIDRQLQGG